ncbi:hypothetical protein VPNG_07593 [Cytospora leucostoma]|uniref:SPT2 chromatin protein n=1 Tax=Cytospora leucostoma TaxID=1230097 RepID=A0A423WDM7_9PEZI|nr:hypothetical protein VPNG_07593 [Cytospora leucostoma]
MPIGDLLASITGEKSNAAPSARPAGAISAKRKADGDAGGSVQKAPRTTPTVNGSARPSDNAPKRLAERPSSGYTGSARPTPTTTNNIPRPLTERSALSASKKPSLTANGKPPPASSSFPGSTARPAASSALSGTKAPAASNPNPILDPNAKAPKKGSYAEIKARAAAAATKLQTIGKIQHKAVEGKPTKKEREQAAADEAKLAKKGLKPGSKPGTNGTLGKGNGIADRTKALGQKGPIGKSGKVAPVEEKRPKKAATATTGYAGSARLAPSKGKPGAAKPSAPDKERGRDRQPNPMGMFGGGRRRKDDDYDEDMDDFVVDDEEEEEAYGYEAPRYRYADDDDESDMEAGYSDVEVEETQAERLARLEDQREEAILERRRREKEAKKKSMLQGKR